ncbi:DNA helicase [Malassezia vespertilionis]|uniref:DNA helicase n=1 Tax=Malassezia vespertilionis TaxID=2020962 RepID=UPI0024B19E10|nr:DNA helicase [Malassezia vespertilionis]WFD08221.1 DNA helicase [Malassezia vespertilionis]
MDVADEFDDEFDRGILEHIDVLELQWADKPTASQVDSGSDTLDPAMEALFQTYEHAAPNLPRRPFGNTANLPRPKPAPLKSQVPLSARDASQAPGNALVQQGLFGQAFVATPTPTPTRSTEVHSSQGHVSMAATPSSFIDGARVKTWDHTVFEQGNRVIKRTEEEAADDLVYGPHNPKTPVPRPPVHMTLAVDDDAAQTWIYPVNKPLRAYQLNIVRKALFNNVLVALPTGLGKTFIAAVVILNMFRWYPQGKIIFVAPTRPLVTQQQQACHTICGLPWDTAIELTGSTRRALRDDEWQTKRIFYMTPQTFENDLLSTTCNPRDVVCVVVDEAHRATGNYAYCKVIRHLMYYNPHFRVLALTATPGSRAEQVQDVVNNLHINRIEIRTEEALDIQQYVHHKHEHLIRVPLGAALEELRRAWVNMMQVFYEPLAKVGMLRTADPATLRPFAVRAAAADPHGRRILVSQPYLRGSVTNLASMALALQYLTEQSVRVFCERVQAIAAPAKSSKKVSQKDKLFSTSNPQYCDLLEKMEHVEQDASLATHPKMHELRRVLLGHFAKHKGDTRAMVFCSYRQVVTEIVALLQEAGLRATPFIGQSTDAKGNRGFTQKVQEQVIRDFQAGTFQVLVATSIGEEGLDIGEVDLIACYEAVRDSVRTLQRVGRTGRMRDGQIVVLMTEGREEHNWQHSKDSYKNVQKLVRSATTVELYTDVDRLLPAHCKPEPVMCEVDQPAFDLSALKRTARRSEPKKVRKKRGAAPPDGALLAFCSAGAVRRDAHREGEAPHTAHSSSSVRTNLSDDSEDDEIASGIRVRSSSNTPYSWPSSHGESQRGRALGTRRVHASPCFARYAPHPLVATLAGEADTCERPAPSPVSPCGARERATSPSLHVPTSDDAPSSHLPDDPLLLRSDALSDTPSPPPSPPPRQKKRRIGASPTSRLLFCHEAERDTDSEVHGESDEDDDGDGEEDEADRAMIGDFVPTQAPGYNQESIYLQSLLSQNAPAPFRKRDRLQALLQRRDALQPLSEPGDASLDTYSQDSFVVGDDDISWASDASER